MLVCHQNYVPEDSIGRLNVSGHCDLCESELYVFAKLCPVGFLLVCECSWVLLQSVVMSYVDYGDDGLVVR